jgi:hypothetical protein
MYVHTLDLARAGCSYKDCKTECPGPGPGPDKNLLFRFSHQPHRLWHPLLKSLT